MRSAATLEGQCRVVEEEGVGQGGRRRGGTKRAQQAPGLIVIKQPYSKEGPMNKSANPSIRGMCLNLS